MHCRSNLIGDVLKKALHLLLLLRLLRRCDFGEDCWKGVRLGEDWFVEVLRWVLLLVVIAHWRVLFEVVRAEFV